MPEETTTIERILAAARREFLEKGFKSSSLRRIVKQAGVTTGAFYGYFDGKEELFAALVEPTYQYILKEYKTEYEHFSSMSNERKAAEMGNSGRRCMGKLLEYSAEHKAELRLLAYCSDGTKYAGMTDELTELEIESTHEFYGTLSELGYPVEQIDERLEHIITRSMMEAFLSLIADESMSYEDSVRYIDDIESFYSAGWANVMNKDWAAHRG